MSRGVWYGSDILVAGMLATTGKLLSRAPDLHLDGRGISSFLKIALLGLAS